MEKPEKVLILYRNRSEYIIESDYADSKNIVASMRHIFLVSNSNFYDQCLKITYYPKTRKWIVRYQDGERALHDLALKMFLLKEMKQRGLLGNSDYTI